MTARILVVEDEEALCALLEYNLRKEGFSVQICKDGEEALIAVTDPAFTPADAVRMLERYPDARLSITPDRAWGAAHPAIGWLNSQIR